MLMRNREKHSIKMQQLRVYLRKWKWLFGTLLLFLICRRAQKTISWAFSKHNEAEVDIDVVYTWVNGSDPQFVKSLQQVLSESRDQQLEADKRRFNDNDELRYSMRSLEVNAPWIRNIYVVTNGQVPCWLNTSNPRIKMVFHSDIFDDPSHLPTFNSAAIEVHLHKIKGLSEQFIYFNDDFLLGSPITFEDFYTKKKGIKIYQAGRIPKPDLYDDNGDAIVDGQTAKAAESSPADVYSASLRYVAHLMKLYYNVRVTRQIAHVPYLINRSIMTKLQLKLQRFYNATSSHRFRRPDDVQFPLAYFSYVINEGIPTEVAARRGVAMTSIGNDWMANKWAMRGLQKSKFVCLNDNIDYKNENSRIALEGVQIFMQGLYPRRSSFENAKREC